MSQAYPGEQDPTMQSQTTLRNRRSIMNLQRPYVETILYFVTLNKIR